MKKVTSIIIAVGLAVAGFTAGSFAAGREPAPVAQAIHSLQDARAHLDNVERDTGGRRERAVKLIKQAIEELAPLAPNAAAAQ